MSIALFVVATALAAPPPLVPFQGVLRNTAGQPVSDGAYTLTTRLYASGIGGAPVFEEIHIGTVVADGVFARSLGGGSTVNGSPLLSAKLVTDHAELWVEIQVEAEPPLPRTRLLSVPYALMATHAEYFGGLPPSAYARADAVSDLPTTYTITGEQNVEPGAPLRIMLRNIPEAAVKRARLDLWAFEHLVPGGKAATLTETTDVDFALGTIEELAVDGTGTAASLVLGAGLDTGADGDLVVSGTLTLDPPRAAVSSGTAGARALAVSSTAGFLPGQAVLIHQTVGTGLWQESRVTFVGLGTILVADDLITSFTSNGANRAQVVVVPSYATVDVQSGGTLTGPQWDGNTGGILAFRAVGVVNITGSVNMDGRGFRGANHESCGYRNQDGGRGEGHAGTAGTGNSANGSGGGGGQGTQDAGAGGGGGYGTAGTAGGNCGGHAGGSGGGVVGDDALSTLYFGGAGGEGGADEDGSWPGRGGFGGGVVRIASRKSIVVNGSIGADGAAGGSGCQTCCGGGGGMGAGGGGAGGAVLLDAPTLTLGVNRVHAHGGSGGSPCSACCTAGGSGGVGRIAVAGQVTGGTSPALTATTSVAPTYGSFASDVRDAGVLDAEISSVVPTVTLNSGTLTLSVRAANTEFSATANTPAWKTVGPGGIVNAVSGRYVQVRAEFEAGPTGTPRLDDIAITVKVGAQLGTLPQSVGLRVGGVSVLPTVATPFASGDPIASAVDLTSAFNTGTAAYPVTALEVTSTRPGRVQWFVWIEP